MFEREEVAFFGRVVDLEVVGECIFGVNDAVLLSPKDVFALLSGDLRPWDEDDGLFEAVSVEDVVPYV